MLSTSIRFIALSMIVCTAGGCITLAVGAMAGASGAVFVKGQLKETLDGDVFEVQTAARQTLEEIGVTVFEDNWDEGVGSLRASYADGKDVWIDITSITPQRSRIMIRVGILGDQIRSDDILSGTKRHLGER